jgi:hypothetical protein
VIYTLLAPFLPCQETPKRNSGAGRRDSEGNLIFNVYDWRVEKQAVIRAIEEEIEKRIGEKGSGCVVIKISGPMSGEDAVRVSSQTDT